MKYTRRHVPEFEAVQWDGSDEAFAKILALPGVKDKTEKYLPYLRLSLGLGEWVILEHGDFVVSGDEIEVYSEEDFHKLFKELP